MGTAKPADTGRNVCSNSSAVGWPCLPRHGDGEAEDHPCDRRVHAAGVYERPRDDGQRHQDPPLMNPALNRQPEQPNGDHGQREGPGAKWSV